MQEKKRDIVVFISYCIFLIWLIIFKLNFSLSEIQKVRDIYIIPFYFKNFKLLFIPLFDAILNFLVFVPFGVLIQKILKTKLYLKIIITFLVSLFFETFQYALAIGISDITDLITNTLGGVVGILIESKYSLTYKDIIRFLKLK